ncbi:hypothetical protein BJX76DRAFT_366971 [Aspergillus varians]
MHTHHYPYTSLLTHLSTHLPHSGPLLRRIQHQTTHPSPTAQVLASFPPESDPESEPGTPWLAAYADIPKGPDTQVWLFSSLETKTSTASASASTHDETNNTTLSISTNDKETIKLHLLDLFTLIRTRFIPPYLDWLSSQPQPPIQPPAVAKDEGVKKIPPHAHTSILLGTVHKALVELVCELAAESKVWIHRGQDVFYAKYCFPLTSFNNDNDNTIRPDPAFQLRDGSRYRFTDSNGISGIQEHHLDLVKNRTNIPRSKRALLAMGGVALYSDDSDSHSHSLASASASAGAGVEKEKGTGEMPMAWAFLGFDGSLSTLHVEPEHRGKGLGGIVGREVMKRGVDFFEPDSHAQRDSGEEWFFADVAVQNLASRRVMEKMGGKVGWTVAWMVVEVDEG